MPVNVPCPRRASYGVEPIPYPLPHGSKHACKFCIAHEPGRALKLKGIATFGTLLTMRLLVRTVNWHSWRRRFAGQFGHTRLSTLRCMFRITTLHTIINESAPIHPMAAKTHRRNPRNHEHCSKMPSSSDSECSSTTPLESWGSSLNHCTGAAVNPDSKADTPKVQNVAATATAELHDNDHRFGLCVEACSSTIWPSARPFGPSTNIERSQKSVASAKHCPPWQTSPPVVENTLRPTH